MPRTFTFRPRSPRTLDRLEQRARLLRLPKTALADRYVEEGLAMDTYPGIVFRDGPAGRRPAVLGGPDVWEVIQVFLDEGRDVRATSETLNLRPGLVEAAVAYYADHRQEVDEWIQANREMMEEAAAAFARRQALERG
ncbi:MAG TPA: hypothetical protein VFD01_23240 [Candidatus Dormibacteraeota bacterium]|jgi:hypothetical protein|nr:hypothetical protein [Candidatus Dormibacteraeota bacterium]